MFGVPGTDPYGWGLTTLGECCELNPRRPKDINVNNDYSFVAMPSVSDDGRINASITKPYSEVCKGFTYFAENDVLFAKITPCMENGKGCVAVGLKNSVGFGSTEFHVLRPIEGISDPYWLYIITMFRKFRTDAEKVMTGTGGQRRVPLNYLNEYSIALPPLELQEQFAAFVRQSDKSKYTIKKLITKEGLFNV
ncbi:MAG: restriction endonuclease subunit S [Clostridiales bacterium]|nr:restriction endonuclease subunit S [Clostridiales bacterium]